MRISSKLVGVGVLALVTGCSSIPQLSSLSKLNPFASKKTTDQPAPLVELKGTMAVRTAWKLDIGKAGPFAFSPVLVGNTVIVAGNGGDIARVEAASGKLLWRIKAGSELSSGVGTDGNMIVVGGDKGKLLAFDMDGKKLWDT